MEEMDQASPLKGCRALVTGASSGIGRAIAEQLLQKGARVALVARRKAPMLELVADYPERALALATDLTKSEELEAAARDAAGFGDGLDLLVNAAGHALLSPVHDGNPEDWDAMWAINVRALTVLTKEVLPHFPEGGGQVVNVGSMSGHRVPHTGGFYAATKFAVRAVTEALRSELRGKGNLTQVMHVAPGFVQTPLAEEYLGAVGKSVAELGFEPMQPSDVAAQVIHALEAPGQVEVNDLWLRPRGQAV